MTKEQSRPSKSLLDVSKYKEYQKYDFNIKLLDEFSEIENGNISNGNIYSGNSNIYSGNSNRYNFAIIESLTKIKKYINSDTNSIIKEIISEPFISEVINVFDTSTNSILVFFSNNIKLIDINNILSECTKGDTIIINYFDLFTFPSIELLIIILNSFSKIKIYYSKILKKNILIGLNFNDFDVFNKIYNKISQNIKKMHIRQYGIYTDTSLINKIYNHNNQIFDYYIQKNTLISKIQLMDEKKYLFEHYKKNIMFTSDNSNSISNCNHNLFYSYFYDCYLCKNCYNLFHIT